MKIIFVVVILEIFKSLYSPLEKYKENTVYKIHLKLLKDLLIFLILLSLPVTSCLYAWEGDNHLSLLFNVAEKGQAVIILGCGCFDLSSCGTSCQSHGGDSVSSTCKAY